jgi:hypothetical protein
MLVLFKRTPRRVDASAVDRSRARRDYPFYPAGRLSTSGAAYRLGEFLVFARAAAFLLTD